MIGVAHSEEFTRASLERRKVFQFRSGSHTFCVRALALGSAVVLGIPLGINLWVRDIENV